MMFLDFIIPISYLVGGLEHEFYFFIYWECHTPIWLSYFLEGLVDHQPAIIIQWLTIISRY